MSKSCISKGWLNHQHFCVHANEGVDPKQGAKPRRQVRYPAPQGLSTILEDSPDPKAFSWSF